MIKAFRYILFTIAISAPVLAQPNPDSLLQAIKSSAKDSTLLNNIYNQLAKSKDYQDSVYDDVVKEFITVSYSNNWAIGIAKGNELAGSRLYNRGNFNAAQSYFENIITLSKKEKVPVNYLANAYKMLAGILFNTGKAEDAIEKANKAIDLYQLASDTLGLAKTINLLGGIYWNLGKLDLASQKLYQALELREKIGDSLGVAHAYNNIGLIYDTQKKQNEALEMYYKALSIYQKLNDNLGIGRACNNIATILKDQKKYTESLDMFLKSYEIDVKRNNIDDQGKTLNNIGQLYLDIGNPKEGISYFLKAKSAFEQSQNENGLAAILLNLGRANSLTGNLNASKAFYTQALELATKLKSTEWQRDAHKGIYTILKHQGDYKNAIEHLEMYKMLSDTLNSLSNLNNLDKLRIEYETEKKEHEIKLLQKDNELKQFNIKRQKAINLFLLSVVLSGTVIVLLSYIYLRKLKKDKHLLQEMNSEILIQKEEIETQRDMLEININELNQHRIELALQTEQIEKQNRLLEYANHRITEGLEYASLIQRSLLSNPTELEKFFRKQAMLYKPKDYVGGDIYWHHELDDGIIFSIADCTGHGVAGAFMSIMAISILKDAVTTFKLNDPSEIASHLYTELINSNAKPFDSNLLLGIDFIICKFTKGSNQMEYSGHKISFDYFDSNKNFSSLRPKRNINRQSGLIEFKTETIDITAKGKLFFYTDGYIDQISETKRKKLGKPEFIKLLSQTIDKPVDEQVEYLERFMEKWKGSYEQVDDALVLGIEI
jgi:serine phosphatase RsbU (regulator of sigma subunit)/Flp pilus assembly protein TadD